MVRFCDRDKETKGTTTTRRHMEKNNIKAGKDGNDVTITGKTAQQQLAVWPYETLVATITE